MCAVSSALLAANQPDASELQLIIQTQECLPANTAQVNVHRAMLCFVKFSIPIVPVCAISSMSLAAN